LVLEMPQNGMKILERLWVKKKSTYHSVFDLR
jgi:hypothetical protein